MMMIVQDHVDSLPEEQITVTLPDGSLKSGVAFKTSPYDIAKQISQGLADNCVIAKIKYTSKASGFDDNVVAFDDEEEAAMLAGHSVDADDSKGLLEDGELWDLNRPLIGNCHMQLLKFDDPQAKTVFWHSSAHVLGGALEAVLHALSLPAMFNK